MSEITACPECKVPSQFSETHLWLGGGVIVQGNDQEHRMVLLECANLVKEQVRRHDISVEPLIEAVNITGHVLGYGDSKLIEVIYVDGEDDVVKEQVSEPYSILLWCGDLSGSSEAVTGKDHVVDYHQLSADLWELRAWPKPRPEELQERLQLKKYDYVEGDIELERCPSCGGPSAFSAYSWDTKRGVIETAATGRRVALLGPGYLETIFEELERELGEEIPGVVVEAQRRFTNKGLYSAEEIGTEDEFRDLLALRGLGNLREMKIEKSSLKMRLQNTCLHLMIAGLIQAYFETATGSDSQVEWELEEDGTLELEVTARS
jgi:hypothetical protein